MSIPSERANDGVAEQAQLVPAHGSDTPKPRTRRKLMRQTELVDRVKAYDPVTLMLAVLVLSAFAALAGFIPARHAASIEPMHALRIE